MGETTKKHVKTGAQQEHGGGRSDRRRNRRGEQEGVRAPLYNRDQYDQRFSVFKLYFCFSNSVVLVLDPGDL